MATPGADDATAAEHGTNAEQGHSSELAVLAGNGSASMPGEMDDGEDVSIERYARDRALRARMDYRSTTLSAADLEVYTSLKGKSKKNFLLKLFAENGENLGAAMQLYQQRFRARSLLFKAGMSLSLHMSSCMPCFIQIPPFVARRRQWTSGRAGSRAPNKKY